MLDNRVTAIQKYYTNLDYIQISKADAVSKISTLTSQLTEQLAKKNYYNISNTSKRFYEIAFIIKKNWFLFASFCKHIDIITTIVEYLIDIGEKMELHDKKILPENDKIEYISVKNMTLTYLTLYNVCPESEVRSFLDVVLTLSLGNIFISAYLNGQINEIILLEDSDLDAVVKCLKIIEKEALTKIWIHEQIKEKFLWFKMKYFRDSNFPIHTFRSKRELLTPNIYNKMSIVSIWSEDITAAKNLAKSLNKTILFINTHLDFYGGVVLMPYIKIIDSMHTASGILNSPDDFISKSSGKKIDATQVSKMMSISIYNLFYDGKWQKSTNTTYCKYDNRLWANATKDDIRKCVNSAQKGFEIWSTKPIHLRKKLLHNVIEALVCSGYAQLNCLSQTLISNFHQFNKFQTYVTKKGLEVTKERVPLGIVILKEKDEAILFDQLLKLLLAGNSVIVIHNANFYNFAPHCDIFATCRMPPGVVNVLSNDDIESLESYLCKFDYLTYKKKIYDFSHNCTGYATQFKEIILPLK